MEVRRQITLCFIVCCSVSFIYTEDLADGNHTSTPLPNESSELTRLERRNFSGKITARKVGAKLIIKIESKDFWKDNKKVVCERSSTGIDSKTCTAAVKQKGEKGDEGAEVLQSVKGQKGEKGVQGDSGPPGKNGDEGEPGSNGVDGQKGDKGADGIYSDLHESRTSIKYGSTIKPAYTCRDIGTNGAFYLNIAHHFEVMCQERYRSCIKIIKKSSKFNGLKKNEAVYLSSQGLQLNEFYNLYLSQLSYLMATNDVFHLTLEYSKEVKMIKILCWNGIEMKILHQPVKVQRGCQIIKNEEKNSFRLELECKPANYLPLDFFIEATENFSIELKSLCFM